MARLSIQIQQLVDQRQLLLRELRVVELPDIFEHTLIGTCRDGS